MLENPQAARHTYGLALFTVPPGRRRLTPIDESTLGNERGKLHGRRKLSSGSATNAVGAPQKSCSAIIWMDHCLEIMICELTNRFHYVVILSKLVVWVGLPELVTDTHHPKLITYFKLDASTTRLRRYICSTGVTS